MRKSFTLFALLSVINFVLANEPGKGGIAGVVVDLKTGETLIGVSVFLEGTTIGGATDLDGKFTINGIEAGKYNVVIKYVGYQTKIEREVNVQPTKITTLNVTLSEDQVNLQEVVVKAEMVKRDNESAITIMQRNSTVIQSGVSAEEMKRSPDKNSGEVLRRVSGSTIQDGKFAIIRGLSDRYNMAMLNNVILPSTEPDRKAFSFDVFPSNILDNIIIMKTGQPNLPSEWAGGLIQLNTKDIPEKNFINVSYGIGFNEGTTFKPFSTYEGSSTDFLGLDKGVRNLPNNFPSIVDLSNMINNGKTEEVKTLGKQLNTNSWRVNQTRNAYPSQSIQISGGLSKKIKEVNLGGVFALSYSNTPQFAEGKRTRYDFAAGEIYYDFNDKRYNTSTSTALLASVGAVIKSNHKLSWKNIYTINGDNTVIQREGVSIFQSTEMRRTNLEFINSRVFNTNLSGDHVFTSRKLRLKWNGGYVLVNRDQPKSIRYSYERFYTSAVPLGPNEANDPFLYQIQDGGADPKLSAMFHSYLKERVWNGGLDFTVPFNIGKSKHSLTTGYSYINRTRDFEARNLFYNGRINSSDAILAEQDVNKIINQENIESGKIYLAQVAFPTDMYRAKSQTHSAYVMLENNIGQRFKAVWGFRFESFSQSLSSPTKLTLDVDFTDPSNPVFNTLISDSTYRQSYFSGAYKVDSFGKSKSVFPLLPSINMMYKLNESMNLRLSYSQSMSRPEFREVSPFRYYDFLRDVDLTGNVNLLQTFIHNVDFRYEWFMGKGQSLNVSAFYKNFQNTIELTSISAGGVPQFTYSNADKAFLAGIEFEVRKNLGFITNKLEDLTFVSNFSYVFSQVNLESVVNNNSDELIRPMQGQSPYIINLGLSYVHPKVGTGVSLLYNQTGHRLYASGEVGNPAWYEHWRPLLDLQISQRFWKNRGIVRFTISDLIAKPTLWYQNHIVGKERQYQSAKDKVVISQTNYRNFSLQIGFNF